MARTPQPHRARPAASTQRVGFTAQSPRWAQGPTSPFGGRGPCVMVRRFQISPASQGWEGLTACSALLPFARQAPTGHGWEATQPGETLTVKIKTRIRAEGKRKQPCLLSSQRVRCPDWTALASPGLRPHCLRAAPLAPHPDLLNPAGCGLPRRSTRVPVHAKAASPGGAGTVGTPCDPSELHPASPQTGRPSTTPPNVLDESGLHCHARR